MNEKTKYEITVFDYNDVFDKYEVDFKTYDDAVKYVEDQIKPEYRNRFEWTGTDPDSYVCYYPVTDDNDNEIDPSDDNYEKYADMQESRIELGYTIEEIEN